VAEGGSVRLAIGRAAGSARAIDAAGSAGLRRCALARGRGEARAPAPAPAPLALMPMVTLTLMLTGLVAGCGSGGGGARVSWAAKCRVGCQPKSDGPCAGEDAAACVEDCTALTAGRSALCAQCLAERTRWSGSTCTCSASGCTACSSSGGVGTCQSGAPGSCIPGKKCTGYHVGETSDCRSECSTNPGVDGGGGASNPRPGGDGNRGRHEP